MDITEVTRRQIIDYLIDRGVYWGKLDVLEFLGRTWDLEAMPALNQGQVTAYRDIQRHYVYFGDWDDHYLLYTYFDLIRSADDIFLKFLENCVHPIVIPDIDEASELLALFNSLLANDGYVLREVSRLSAKPIYKGMRLKAGVQGSVKNLIFAANGPKPDIVLIDSVSNDIKIVRNEEYCLVYDRPVLERGLLWIDLLDWWREQQKLIFSDQRDIEVDLYRRLQAALPHNSPPEKLLFWTYFSYFRGVIGDNLPALIPQVYLHYDPKTISQVAGGQRLIRQRMDFLLLFSNHTRIVLEIDGKQHYAEGDTAKPELYATMVAEDRRLCLGGYEIYRFGGYELQGEQGKM
jgi:AbiJ N-terminal domain 3